MSIPQSSGSENPNAVTTPRKGSGLRRKLLRSHLTVAAIGLGVLLVMLIVTLWLRVYALRLAEVRGPTARTSMQALAGVQRSLASLRGWTLLNDESFKMERERAWKEEIEPAVARLKELSRDWTNPNNKRRLVVVQKNVKELKEAQWWIQDVANTPGNEPARDLLAENVRPVSETILAAVSAMIDMERARAGRLLATLADQRDMLGRCQAALDAFVDEAVPSDKLEFQTLLEQAAENLELIAAEVESLTPEQRGLFDLVQDEIRAFTTLSAQVVGARESEEWNVAEYRLANEAVPTAREVTKILSAMAENQDDLMTTDAKLVTFISNAAIAISLILIVGMTLAAAIVSIRGARRLSDPILALSRATQQMVAGKLKENIPVTGDDELGDLTDSFNRMRASLEQTSEALVRRDAQSRSIIASSPAALIMANRGGDIVLLNKQAEILFGYTQEDLVGRLIFWFRRRSAAITGANAKSFSRRRAFVRWARDAICLACARMARRFRSRSG